MPSPHPRMCTLAVAIGLLVLVVGHAAAKQSVNFDFAWRHFLGDPTPQHLASSSRLSPPPASQPSFDDSSWSLVDAPHDMLIHQQFNVDEDRHQAFLPRGSGWYRKHFNVPSSWQNSSVWVYFEGVFHETKFWLNGEQVFSHASGYTSFFFRIDKQLFYEKENVLAVYVNASTGTGWWYEGGGLMRHQFLVQAHRTHIIPDSTWVFAKVESKDILNATAAKQAVFYLQTDVANDASAAASVRVRATLLSQDGKRKLASVTSASNTIPGGSHAQFSVAIPLKLVNLWSITKPYVYTMQVEVLDKSDNVVDQDSVPAGARTTRFDANHGFFLNEQPVKLRGFCDHSTFGGVGGAVPDRVNLFRVQALRSIGANAWRMAHNPPEPSRLSFMDYLGMAAMDENRDYGGHIGQGGNTSETAADEVMDMGDMVRRDRIHPSVILWSFCNEVGCNNETSAKPFRNITYALDGTRPVTQNQLLTNTSSFYLDVQGFSHNVGLVFDLFHKREPTKPTLATECCSCSSQRGEDADLTPANIPAANATRPGLFYNNLIQECMALQVLYSDSREFVSGTFVWSGFDYYGESVGWPQVAKCRGVIGDLAGFTKETAYWFKSWWLSAIPTTDAGRPALPPEPTIFIVESWVPLLNGSIFTDRHIHVYGSTPTVDLLLNGKSFGKKDMPHFGAVSYKVAYAPGNVTAIGMDNDGKVVATYSIFSAGQPAAIQLSIDAPSKTTGTGDYLVLDGQDTAMLRATIVDANGVVVPNATNNVTFSIISGDGAVVATHNGDPASRSPANATWHAAYHALVRCFVRSTKDEASPFEMRRLMAFVDVDGGRLTRYSDVRRFAEDPQPIVVRADSPGLKGAVISISTSRDPSLSALRLVVSQGNALFSS
ncbi:Glycosyl hydrolases family 2, sugar binding domain protein [Balamuthia mandrillaris]